jgi:YesN/AraC family two-component response regulator
VRTFLLMEGKFLVKEAASGSEALELLMQESFDVIISDFEMNGGNGFWLLKKVKELQLDTHFIIFSGQIFLSRDIVLAAGADAFFSKPFSLRLMMEHLRELTL